jgi:hypothetical protein
MPFIVDRYTSLQRKRLEAKPGITGLWQLSADRHAEIHENIEYDLYYIGHQSLMLDMLILLETVFFTIGVVVKAILRRSEQDAKPAIPTSSVEGVDEPYVLVALDQRRDGTQPATWQKFVPAAYAIADRWPVKLLVAPGNVEVFDKLLDEPVSRLGRHKHRAEYVSYRSRVELRSLVMGAQLVITDLPHVGAWAKEAGKGVLLVSDDGVRWSSRQSVATDIVRALTEALPTRTVPAHLAQDELADGTLWDRPRADEGYGDMTPPPPETVIGPINAP